MQHANIILLIISQQQISHTMIICEESSLSKKILHQ